MGIDALIEGRQRDLGDGFVVRRVLPFATHRMVGPFIFFDHMGPLQLKPGAAMSVRPHPHINLATVTYLFEGRIHHRDSLGSDQVIEPGAVNWMTAGRGIVHSERSPEDQVTKGDRINGIQLWVALPTEQEECAPTFTHHPKNSLPEFEIGQVKVKLLLGEALGHKSPVPLLSDLFYAELRMEPGRTFTWPAETRESAAYVAEGAVQIDQKEIKAGTMIVFKKGRSVEIEAMQSSRVMLLGGTPVGPRHIYWNFVSSSEARIEEAKGLWKSGPSSSNARFQTIPGDDREMIPLPKE